MDDDLGDLLQQLRGTPPEAEPSEPQPSKTHTTHSPALKSHAVTVLPAGDDPFASEVQRYLKQYDDVAREVLGSCRDDRAEIQTVVDLLYGRVQQQILTGIAVEDDCVKMLVKALEVKSNVNGTAVKVMDTAAKILSATKPKGVNIQNNVVASNDDLISMLETPAGEI